MKDLRLSLKDEAGNSLSQTEFGRLIGKSLNTVQRYEQLVPPRGRVLIELSALALSRRRPEHARIFSQALENEFGVPLHGKFLEFSRAIDRSFTNFELAHITNLNELLAECKQFADPGITREQAIELGLKLRESIRFKLDAVTRKKKAME